MTMDDATRTDDAETYITLAEAAELLHLAPKSVLRWVREKPKFRVLASKVGRSYLFRKSDILAYIKAQALSEKPKHGAT